MAADLNPDPKGVGRWDLKEDALPGLMDKQAIWKMGRKKA